MELATLAVLVRAVQQLFSFLERSGVDEADLTPEYLDARDAVRQAAVDIANQLGDDGSSS